MSIKSLCSELETPPLTSRKESRKSLRAREDGGYQKNKASWINWLRLISTHRYRSSKRRTYLALHQDVCVYIIAFSLVFLWESWTCELLDLWFLYLLLGIPSFCWAALPSLCVISFLFYCILLFLFLFSLEILCSPESLFFSTEKHKGMDPEWRCIYRENCNQNLFSSKGNEKKY